MSYACNNRTGMSGLIRFISARTALPVAPGRSYSRKTPSTCRVVTRCRAWSPIVSGRCGCDGSFQQSPAPCQGETMPFSANVDQPRD
jgi:hypothetical protein